MTFPTLHITDFDRRTIRTTSDGEPIVSVTFLLSDLPDEFHVEAANRLGLDYEVRLSNPRITVERMELEALPMHVTKLDRELAEVEAMAETFRKNNRSRIDLVTEKLMEALTSR